MEDRKTLTRLLHDFTASQKELFAQAEERLQEYKEKLMKVYQVREELHSHIQSLPDMSQLPDVSAGLPPLPSAGDLFSLRWRMDVEGSQWRTLLLLLLFSRRSPCLVFLLYFFGSLDDHQERPRSFRFLSTMISAFVKFAGTMMSNCRTFLYFRCFCCTNNDNKEVNADHELSHLKCLKSMKIVSFNKNLFRSFIIQELFSMKLLFSFSINFKLKFIYVMFICWNSSCYFM